MAEVNQGGELVEQMVRSIDPKVSYTSVRATRGKRVRAEPIAALYERGMVHHVGRLKQLETQLCQYTPQSKQSPDRLDGLVWALSDLMLGSRKKPHFWMAD